MVFALMLTSKECRSAARVPRRVYRDFFFVSFAYNPSSSF